jgi:hypothetical protein
MVGIWTLNPSILVRIQVRQLLTDNIEICYFVFSEKCMEILIEREEGAIPGFYARLVGHDDIWGNGNSIDEAIGNLVRTQRLIFSDLRITMGAGIEHPVEH